jgi:serine protease AprX
MFLAARNHLKSGGAAVLLVGALLAGTASAATSPGAAVDAGRSASLGSTRAAPAAAPSGAQIDPALRGLSGPVSVIVTGDGVASEQSSAARTVGRLGGRVTQPLPIISGFAATMPADAVANLASVPGVRAITLNGKMHVQTDPAVDATTTDPAAAAPAAADPAAAAPTTPDPTAAASAPVDPTAAAPATDDSATANTASNDPASANPAPADPAAAAASATSTPPDPNTLPSVYRQVMGADALAGRGATGRGITVALVDTGVSSLPDVANSLVPIKDGAIGGIPANCVNLSGEPTCNDEYGHGTFLAGLISGNGAASNGAYRGTAPDAQVLSLKIAGPDGSADVSKVLAAIQWVVSFRDIYHIRVLNLSLGTDSTQSYRVDPLNYAVEAAWRNGIVVTVAASNRGPGASTISKPGDDPFVLTVGALDDKGTADQSDDTLPNFSSRGPTASDGLSKPDIAAPGAHLVSLASPGSTITTTYPSAMAAPYRRGSGTSMATAAVSGLIADMLSKNGALTPDQVKYALMSTARPTAATSDRLAVGSGLIDGAAALNAPMGSANQGVSGSDGRGSLDLSRGHAIVQTDDKPGVVLSGDTTAQLKPWSQQVQQWLGSTWAGSTWAGSTWAGSTWAGSTWAGSTWAGSTWAGSTWAGSTWAGSTWASAGFYGVSGEGSAFYGAWDQ